MPPRGRVYADARREGDDEATHEEPEGMSGADLYASRLVREYRAEMARHREEMLRQQWESMQEESQSTCAGAAERCRA